MAKKMNKCSLRREAIYQELVKGQYLSIVELARKFHISESTVKRDVNYLQEKELVHRVHGGVYATEPDPDVIIPDYSKRFMLHKDEKIVIAKRAAEMIEDGDVVFLDAGSTINYMLQYIQAKNVTIFTNAVSIIMLMVEKHYDLTVNILPGELLTEHLIILGMQTFEEVENLYFDKVFLGGAYVDIDRGLLTASYNEKMSKNILSKRGDQVILCADSSKLGSFRKMQSVAFKNIDCFITDKYLSWEMAKRIEDMGTSVMRMY